MSRKPLSPSEERFLSFGPDVGGEDDIPPPPYQFADGHLIFIGVRFAKGAARQLLPPDLEPAGGDGGLLCNYQLGSGWGIPPFSATYAAVEVKGYDAPDSSPGYYIAAGYYSGGGYRFMHRHYNVNPLPGSSRWFEDGDLAVGVGGPPNIDAVTLCIRPTSPRSEIWSGVHHYLGRKSSGSCVFPIGFNIRAVDGEAVSVDITDAASDSWRLARPVELTFGLECRDTSLTFSVPQPVADAPELAGAGAQVILLEAFARIGRAAVLVAADGEIGAMTPQAQALLGHGIAIPGGRLHAGQAGDQAALEQLIATAAANGVRSREVGPIALRRAEGPPLIVDAMPIGAEATGRPSALLLLNDPARPVRGIPAAALQLLGLTPAEARIADLVGSGFSPREAAERLNNAESTVRTSLIRIYQKLDINRQSELASIVARL